MEGERPEERRGEERAGWSEEEEGAGEEAVAGPPWP